MSKKLILNIVIILLVLSGAGAYGYYRTSKIELCESRLADKPENTACISTSLGLMIVEMYPSEAPKAVERFKKLSNEKKFYDNLEFYRVSKDFVAQAGVQDFQVRNTGVTNYSQEMKDKVALTEEKFETEANFENLSLNDEEEQQLAQEGFTSNTSVKSRLFEYGSISFANAGPNTNSTEFFLVTSKDKNSSNMIYLRGRFSNFGKVIEGTDVLDKINKVQINTRYVYSNEKPADTVKILEIRTK